MAMRLLVEGLDWAVSEARLTDVFTPFGDIIEVRVAMDWETGRSRGFGWISFQAASDAEAAMAALDGQKLAGKTLRVMVAPEQVPRPNFRSADYGYTNAPAAPTGFRNADFDGPVSRPPRTDRKLYRSADFGYVEAPEPPAEPTEPAPKAAPKSGSAPAPAAPVPADPAAPKKRKSTAPPVLLDDEASNRAKYGGWEEREDNEGGRGGSGNPFG